MRLHSTCRQDGTPPGVAQEKIQSLSAAPQASQRGRPANTHLSLRWRGRLRTSLLGVGFVGFMMPNDTASGSTDFSMARHVTRHPADDCSLDASLRLGSVKKCEAQQGGANDQSLDDGLLRGYVRINLGCEALFRPIGLTIRNLMFLQLLRPSSAVEWIVQCAPLFS